MSLNFKSRVQVLGDDFEVTKVTRHISLEHGVTEEPHHAASVHIDVDRLVTAPLTESEATALNTRLRLRMVTKGFRDTPEGREQLVGVVKDYLREIGKSNEGLVFHPGMGWIPNPR